MSHKLSVISVSVFSALLANAAMAADMGQSSGSMFEPVTVKAGVFEVMPWVGVSVGTNNNAGLSNAVKTSSTVTSLNPNVVVGLPTQGQMYAVKYSGNFTQFSKSKVDDFNDHNLSVFADNAWTTRVKSLVNLNYAKGHDGRNAVLTGNKELWHTTELNGMAHYGAEGAIGQFELAAGQVSKRYDSNNSGATRFYDHDKANVKGTFFYRIAPATQMFVEAGATNFNYLVASPRPLDSTEQRYMAGVKWEATAKTTGTIKVGTLNKSFNSALRQNGTATVWDADVTWSPKPYSKFDASLHQTAREDGAVGGYIVSQDSNLIWSQDWSGFVTSALSLGDGVDKFQGGVRTDKRQTYALKATYGFRSWLRANIEYKNTKRNSTDALWSYTQAVTMFTLEGSL